MGPQPRGRCRQVGGGGAGGRPEGHRPDTTSEIQQSTFLFLVIKPLQDGERAMSLFKEKMYSHGVQQQININ